MMMFINRLIAVTLLLAGFVGGAGAQTDPDADPPGRVARLSEFSGQVWLYNADSSSEWVSAVRNRPVTAGDRVATEAGARAELQIGSTTVRLDSNTELEVSAIDDDHVSLELVSGSASARIVDLAGAGQFDLSTDEGRFVVQRAGSYRFDRDGTASRVTAYSGLVRYEGANSGLPVTAGQRAEFWIDSGGVAQYALSAPVNDDFAAWNNDRDRRVLTPVATRYVSPEMTGADELDRYGRWEQSPEYGPLWTPTAVAVDWAPYRSGHWAWVRPWGWTWVDDAPWGFAPFHYGRWVYFRNNWCWTPGARVARPVYAPALVAWVGGPRANVSVTIGGGPSVGWFPLAPREVYVPSYRVSPRYAQNINITHVTNVTVINNVFKNPQAPREFGNRRLQNAITVVPTSVMTSRQPVAPAAAQVRQNPAWAREIANQPARGAVTLVAPPVAAPTAPARVADPRAVRPPPGFAERRVSPNKPGVPAAAQDRERDRDGRGREIGRPEGQRPAPTTTTPPPVAAGQQPAPTAPAANPATATAPAVNPSGPRQGGRAVIQMDNNGERRAAPPPPPRAEDRRGGDERRGEDRRDDRRRGGDRSDAAPQAPAAAPAPAPVATPAPAPALSRPAAAPPAQEAPTMRPLPVQRGEDRRATPPPPVTAPVTRPAAAPPAQEAPTMRPLPVQRGEDRRPAPPPAAAPIARPVEPPHPPAEVRRPAEAPRPAEVHRPAPPPAAAPAPEMKRPEPRPPAAEPKRGGEPRDPRDPRDQQR